MEMFVIDVVCREALRRIGLPSMIGLIKEPSMDHNEIMRHVQRGRLLRSLAFRDKTVASLVIWGAWACIFLTLVVFAVYAQ